MGYAQLKQRHRAERGAWHPNLSLRVHRALSWLDRAEQLGAQNDADGQVSGNGGVNNYSGPFRPGRDRAIALGPFVRTEMAGAEPAMRAEGAYLTLLRQVRFFSVSGETLTLHDAGGNEVLSFAAVPAL